MSKATDISPETPHRPRHNQNYWSLVKRQFQKNRLAVWSLRMIYVLVFLALTADFLANEKPLYCKVDGKTYFPVIRSYLVDLGWANWPEVFLRNDWPEIPYEAKILPPIPYSAESLDLNNRFVGPFDKQEVSSTFYRHWMGTDRLGHDVTAGMIRGARTALLVGVGAMLIAIFIGLILGAIAGFFGDDRLQISRIRILLNLLAFPFAIFYGFMARAYVLSEAKDSGAFWLGVVIFIGVFIVANVLASFLKRIPLLGKKVRVAADILVMRLIEIVTSIPGLILLLAILAILENQSILNIVLIIGLLGWTGIARFIRGELLRVRQLEFIEATRSMGYSNWRIMLRHALPNAIAPVLIAVAFGIAGSILLEAALSFLGIGIAAEDISWGKLLSVSRDSNKAWWVAVFPGFAIFLTITIFNLVGEALSDALNPRLNQ